MRFLFCALASHGFVYPAIGVARELQARGHECALATGPGFAAAGRDALVPRLARGLEDGPSFQVQGWGLPESIALQVVHLQYALNQFPADAIVTSQLALGPLLYAREAGLPVAVMGMAAYLWRQDEEHPNRKPGRAPWAGMLGKLNRAREFLDLPAVPEAEGVEALLGDAFLLRSTPELEGEVPELPGRVHCVGPCLWEPMGPDPEVTAFLETAREEVAPVLYAQPTRSFDLPPFWPALVQALRDGPYRVAASIGRSDGTVSDVPMNFLVRAYLPQQAIMHAAEAVVCGGHSTAVLGALQAGRPLLLVAAGSGSDEIARRCVRAGAAIHLSPVGITPERIGAALEDLTSDPGYMGAARGLESAMASYEGPRAAADLLERLAEKGGPIERD